MKKSKELSHKAKIFLLDKNIESILSAYGRVVYTGSYAADLMVWPDIDIQLILPDNANKLDTILEISKTFLNDSDLKDVKLINFEKRNQKGMPIGMYLGMHLYSKSENIMWKIDVWSLETEHYLRDVEFQKEIMTRLTPELKELIIAWKYKLMGKDDRVPHLGSYALYKGVLFNSLTTDDAIIEHLLRSGVELKLDKSND